MSNYLNEGFANPRFKNKILKLALLGALSGAAVSSILKSNMFSMKEKEQIEQIEQNINIEDLIPNYISKVDSVESHIKRIFSLHPNWNYDELELTPEVIVKLCYMHNYEIAFFIAQLQQESGFGQSKVAKAYNNPFSINCTDNGRRKNYDSQIDCAEDFLNLMNNYYLQGKTPDDLLKGTDTFVNIYGRRYASDPKYEKNVRAIRNGIINKYPNLKSI